MYSCKKQDDGYVSSQVLSSPEFLVPSMRDHQVCSRYMSLIIDIKKHLIRCKNSNHHFAGLAKDILHQHHGYLQLLLHLPQVAVLVHPEELENLLLPLEGRQACSPLPIIVQF